MNEEDLLNTIKVSSEWKKASLELSKNEYKSIEAFVNWIAPKLGEAQKTKLTRVMEGTTILESINLAKIKLSTQELLQQVLSIVGGLNEEEISNLETLVKKEHKPSFFDTLLKLAIIEHDLEDASKIDVFFGARRKAFEKISNRLTALGQHDKALDIALKSKSDKAIRNAIEPVIISNNTKKV